MLSWRRLSSDKMPYPQSRSASPHSRNSSGQFSSNDLVRVPFGGRSPNLLVPADTSSPGWSPSPPPPPPQNEYSRPPSSDGSRSRSRTRPDVPARETPLSGPNGTVDKRRHLQKAMAQPGDHRDWTRSQAFIFGSEHREDYHLEPLLTGNVVCMCQISTGSYADMPLRYQSSGSKMATLWSICSPNLHRKGLLSR